MNETQLTKLALNDVKPRETVDEHAWIITQLLRAHTQAGTC